MHASRLFDYDKVKPDARRQALLVPKKGTPASKITYAPTPASTFGASKKGMPASKITYARTPASTFGAKKRHAGKQNNVCTHAGKQNNICMHAGKHLVILVHHVSVKLASTFLPVDIIHIIIEN